MGARKKGVTRAQTPTISGFSLPSSTENKATSQTSAEPLGIYARLALNVTPLPDAWQEFFSSTVNAIDVRVFSHPDKDEIVIALAGPLPAEFTFSAWLAAIADDFTELRNAVAGILLTDTFSDKPIRFVGRGLGGTLASLLAREFASNGINFDGAADLEFALQLGIATSGNIFYILSSHPSDSVRAIATNVFPEFFLHALDDSVEALFDEFDEFNDPRTVIEEQGDGGIIGKSLFPTHKLINTGSAPGSFEIDGETIIVEGGAHPLDIALSANVRNLTFTGDSGGIIFVDGQALVGHATWTGAEFTLPDSSTINGLPPGPITLQTPTGLIATLTNINQHGISFVGPPSEVLPSVATNPKLAIREAPADQGIYVLTQTDGTNRIVQFPFKQTPTTPFLNSTDLTGTDLDLAGNPLGERAIVRFLDGKIEIITINPNTGVQTVHPPLDTPGSGYKTGSLRIFDASNGDLIIPRLVTRNTELGQLTLNELQTLLPSLFQRFFFADPLQSESVVQIQAGIVPGSPDSLLNAFGLLDGPFTRIQTQARQASTLRSLTPDSSGFFSSVSGLGHIDSAGSLGVLTVQDSLLFMRVYSSLGEQQEDVFMLTPSEFNPNFNTHVFPITPTQYAFLFVDNNNKLRLQLKDSTTHANVFQTELVDVSLAVGTQFDFDSYRNGDFCLTMRLDSGQVVSCFWNANQLAQVFPTPDAGPVIPLPNGTLPSNPPSPTAPPSVTPSITSSTSFVISQTPSGTQVSASMTTSASASATASATQTASASTSRTSSATSSITVSTTSSVSLSASATQSSSATPTASVSATISVSDSSSKSPSLTSEASLTPTPSTTPLPSKTPSPSATASLSLSTTETRTPSASISRSVSLSFKPSPQPEPSPPPSPSVTPTLSIIGDQTSTTFPIIMVGSISAAAAAVLIRSVYCKYKHIPWVNCLGLHLLKRFKLTIPGFGHEQGGNRAGPQPPANGHPQQPPPRPPGPSTLQTSLLGSRETTDANVAGTSSEQQLEEDPVVTHSQLRRLFQEHEQRAIELATIPRRDTVDEHAALRLERLQLEDLIRRMNALETAFARLRLVNPDEIAALWQELQRLLAQHNAANPDATQIETPSDLDTGNGIGANLDVIGTLLQQLEGSLETQTADLADFDVESLPGAALQDRLALLQAIEEQSQQVEALRELFERLRNRQAAAEAQYVELAEELRKLQAEGFEVEIPDFEGIDEATLARMQQTLEDLKFQRQRQLTHPRDALTDVDPSLPNTRVPAATQGLDALRQIQQRLRDVRTRATDFQAPDGAPPLPDGVPEQPLAERINALAAWLQRAQDELGTDALQQQAEEIARLRELLDANTLAAQQALALVMDAQIEGFDCEIELPDPGTSLDEARLDELIQQIESSLALLSGPRRQSQASRVSANWERRLQNLEQQLAAKKSKLKPNAPTEASSDSDSSEASASGHHARVPATADRERVTQHVRELLDLRQRRRALAQRAQDIQVPAGVPNLPESVAGESLEQRIAALEKWLADAQAAPDASDLNTQAQEIAQLRQQLNANTFDTLAAQAFADEMREAGLDIEIPAQGIPFDDAAWQRALQEVMQSIEHAESRRLRTTRSDREAQEELRQTVTTLQQQLAEQAAQLQEMRTDITSPRARDTHTLVMQPGLPLAQLQAQALSDRLELLGQLQQTREDLLRRFEVLQHRLPAADLPVETDISNPLDTDAWQALMQQAEAFLEAAPNTEDATIGVEEEQRLRVLTELQALREDFDENTQNVQAALAELQPLAGETLQAPLLTARGKPNWQRLTENLRLLRQADLRDDFARLAAQHQQLQDELRDLRERQEMQSPHGRDVLEMVANLQPVQASIARLRSDVAQLKQQAREQQTDKETASSAPVSRARVMAAQPPTIPRREAITDPIDSALHNVGDPDLTQNPNLANIVAEMRAAFAAPDTTLNNLITTALIQANAADFPDTEKKAIRNFLIQLMLQAREIKPSTSEHSGPSRPAIAPEQRMPVPPTEHHPENIASPPDAETDAQPSQVLRRTAANVVMPEGANPRRYDSMPPHTLPTTPQRESGRGRGRGRGASERGRGEQADPRTAAVPRMRRHNTQLPQTTTHATVSAELLRRYGPIRQAEIAATRQELAILDLELDRSSRHIRQRDQEDADTSSPTPQTMPQPSMAPATPRPNVAASQVLPSWPIPPELTAMPSASLQAQPLTTVLSQPPRISNVPQPSGTPQPHPLIYADSAQMKTDTNSTQAFALATRHSLTADYHILNCETSYDALTGIPVFHYTFANKHNPTDIEQLDLFGTPYPCATLELSAGNMYRPDGQPVTPHPSWEVCALPTRWHVLGDAAQNGFVTGVLRGSTEIIEHTMIDSGHSTRVAGLTQQILFFGGTFSLAYGRELVNNPDAPWQHHAYNAMVSSTYISCVNAVTHLTNNGLQQMADSLQTHGWKKTASATKLAQTAANLGVFAVNATKAPVLAVTSMASGVIGQETIKYVFGYASGPKPK